MGQSMGASSSGFGHQISLFQAIGSVGAQDPQLAGLVEEQAAGTYAGEVGAAQADRSNLGGVVRAGDQQDEDESEQRSAAEPLRSMDSVGSGEGRGAQVEREKAPARISSRLLLQLLEQQEYRCALTGCPLTPDDAEVDHILPLSKGGEHELSNLQIVTRRVNRAKGDMTPAEFFELCERVTAMRAQRATAQGSA